MNKRKNMRKSKKPTNCECKGSYKEGSKNWNDLAQEIKSKNPALGPKFPDKEGLKRLRDKLKSMRATYPSDELVKIIEDVSRQIED